MKTVIVVYLSFNSKTRPCRDKSDYNIYFLKEYEITNECKYVFI